MGFGSAADGGRVVAVQTWRAPPGTHHGGGAGRGPGVFVLPCPFLSKF